VARRLFLRGGRPARRDIVVAGTDPASAPGQRPKFSDPSTLFPPTSSPVREPTDFEQASSGQYFVFDRRGHAVYASTPPGPVRGRSCRSPGGRSDHRADRLQPLSNGTFVVADAPDGRERVQLFTSEAPGSRGSPLRARGARVVIGTVVLNGVGSLQYTGDRSW